MTQRDPMNEHLEVVATLAGRAIEASLHELRQRAALFEYMRQMLGLGADINDLSAASGIPVDEIVRHVESRNHREEITDLSAT